MDVKVTYEPHADTILNKKQEQFYFLFSDLNSEVKRRSFQESAFFVCRLSRAIRRLHFLPLALWGPAQFQRLLYRLL